MVKRSTLLLGAVGLLAVGFGARRYVQDRNTPRVDYETVARIGNVEIRRYPPTVLVETVAPSENAAFWRLFRYISGANRSSTEVSMTAPVESAGESISMTAPVETEIDSRSESVSMTTPVESDTSEEGVRMAFYLPAEYDYDTAPRPTDDSVRLVEQPGRTLAVLGFSWFTTDGRVARKTEDLLATLAEADDEISIEGEPFLMRYDGPGVPPFLRTNEVAVEVRRTTGN
ncbi:SOUL family heme-binding protein [Salinirubrum litoreum]|uniref:SOUL family heme-binding protein n=1 Tax=Salinirubrum litoreum TaxID=1126234 RepID=A0ABD5RAE3_9EURY|nr:heme-binding protein [Salinirubrum litoreum]